jgi:hypothetical protein
MRISEYPYGKVTKSLRKAVDYLNKSYRKVIKEMLKIDPDANELDLKCGFEIVEFLPKNIYCRLNSDEVDFIQEGWHDLVGRYK